MTKRNLRRLAFQVLAATLALAGPSAMIVKAEATPRSPEGPSSSLETVSGRVKDSTGAVIVGATVTLRAAAGAFSRSVGTDQLGRYRFEGVPPGSYLVDAVRDGFAVATQELRVSAGQAANLDVTLGPASFSEEVTVSFTSEHAQTALKMDAPVHDIPLTVKSYTSSFINALDSKHVSDLYTYMNGINRSGDAAYDLTMRGFESSDPGSIQYNGLVGMTGRQKSANVANIERIEILKGPASVLYGQAPPGGLVNIVTHRPQVERQHLFDFRTGTFFGTGPAFGDRNSFRAATDLTGPLGSSTKVLYRLVVAYDNTRSFWDFTDGEELYVVPSLTWNVSARTILTLEAEYRRFDSAFDNGLLAPQNDINFVGPITARYQEPDDYNKENGWSLNASFARLFSGGVHWSFKWRTVLQDDDRKAFENNRVESDNRRVRRRDRHQFNQQDYHFVDTSLRKPFRTGSVEQTLLVGLNGGHERLDADRIRFRNVGFFVDLRNPVYGAQRPANPGADTHQITDSGRFGAYVQDQITFSPKWKGLAALRYDIQDQHTKEVRLNNPSREKTVGAVVPTGGLVFQPDPRWSIYGSYAQSFIPPPASAQDVQGRNEFEPERGRQLEAGVKVDLARGRLDATASFFHIKKDNVLVSVATGISEQIGQERSRGVEFDLRTTPVKGWQSILGYTYLDAEVTEDFNPRRIGARLRNTPKHAFNLWSRYDLGSGPAAGLGFGLGLIWRGDRVGSFPDQPVVGNPIPGEPFPSEVLRLPGYFRADAGLYYVKNRYELTLRVNNLLDERYYESAFNVIRIRPGNPREATLSVRLRL